MAGSLSGIGQQQVPLSQPFQPGGSESARVQRQQEEREPKNNEVQKSKTSVAAQPRETDSDTNTRFKDDVLSKSLASASNGNDPSAPRGSIVNLTV